MEARKGQLKRVNNVSGPRVLLYCSTVNVDYLNSVCRVFGALLKFVDNFHIREHCKQFSLFDFNLFASTFEVTWDTIAHDNRQRFYVEN